MLTPRPLASDFSSGREGEHRKDQYCARFVWTACGQARRFIAERPPREAAQTNPFFTMSKIDEARPRAFLPKFMIGR